MRDDRSDNSGHRSVGTSDGIRVTARGGGGGVFARGRSVFMGAPKQSTDEESESFH